MKELLIQYANYNIWANKRIIDSLLKLTPEQLDKPIESSFSSIRKTAYHSWGAEDVWWQRIQLIENWRYVGNDLDTPIEEACEKWGVEIAMEHRIGRVELGEPSIAISVGSPHRGQAFEACRYCIDTLKETVPIWKKEVCPDGAFWIEGEDAVEAK